MIKAMLIIKIVASLLAASLWIAFFTFKLLSNIEKEEGGRLSLWSRLSEFSGKVLHGPIIQFPVIAIRSVLDVTLLRTDLPARAKPCEAPSASRFSDDLMNASIAMIVGMGPLFGYLTIHKWGSIWSYGIAAVVWVSYVTWALRYFGSRVESLGSEKHKIEFTWTTFMSGVMAAFFSWAIVESIIAIEREKLEVGQIAALSVSLFLAGTIYAIPALIKQSEVWRHIPLLKWQKWAPRVMLGMAISGVLTASGLWIGSDLDATQPLPKSVGMVTANAIFDVLTVQITIYLLSKTIIRGRLQNGNRKNRFLFDSDVSIFEDTHKAVRYLSPSCLIALRKNLANERDKIFRNATRYGVRTKIISKPTLSIPIAIILDVVLAGVLACLALWIGLLLTPGQSIDALGALRVLIGMTPDGSDWSFGPYFWVMHTTFLPTLFYLSIIGFFFVVRVVSPPVLRRTNRLGSKKDPAELLSSVTGVGAAFTSFIAVLARAVEVLMGAGS